MSATVNVLVQRLLNPMPMRPHAAPTDAALRVMLDRQTEATYRALADAVFADTSSTFYPRVGALLWERLTPVQRQDVATSLHCFPQADDQDALFAEALMPLLAPQRAEVATYLFRQVAVGGRLTAAQDWLRDAQDNVTRVTDPDTAQALHADLLEMMGEAAHQAFVEQQSTVGDWLLRQPGMEAPVMERIRLLLEDGGPTPQTNASDLVHADLLCQHLSLPALEEVEKQVSEYEDGLLDWMPHLTQHLQAFRRQDQALTHTPTRARRRQRRS